MIVFLYGKDAYRVKQNTDKIVGEYLVKHPGGMGITRFNLEENGEFERLEESIKTVGLFAEKKLVVVKNGFAEAEKVLVLIKEWKLLEDKERIIVAVENGSEAELKKKDKKLLALLTVKPVVSKELLPLAGKQLENWVSKEMEELGVNIKIPVLGELVKRVGNDSWRLRLELEKLASYVRGGQEKEINLNILDLLVAKPIEQNIFNTIDALGALENGRALTLLAQHLDDGEDPYYLFSMFVYQFRNLLKVKSLLTGSTIPTSEQVAKRAALHPYVAKKLMAQARQFELAELKQKFTRLAEADILIKNGQVDIIDFLFQTAVS